MLDCEGVCFCRGLKYGDFDGRGFPAELGDLIKDVIHGEVYKEHMSKEAGPEHRIIALVAALDGFNPYKGHHTANASFMPCKLSCMNLHPALRSAKEATWLSFVLHGKQEQDPNFVLEILKDELLYLHHVGVKVKDSSDPQRGEFRAKARLLMLRGDYRGLQKLMRWTGAPAEDGACTKCDVSGLTSSQTGLGKTVYPGMLGQLKA